MYENLPYLLHNAIWDISMGKAECFFNITFKLIVAPCLCLHLYYFCGKSITAHECSRK